MSSHTIEQVLKQYGILRDYCDSLWRSISNTYNTELKCQKGCSQCCILQTVNILEALVIFQNTQATQTLHNQYTENTNKCPYLSTLGECTIYPFRPILCRTHGLLLISEEFIGKIAHTCDHNFTHKNMTISKAAIDIDRITLNTEKLCCALALAAGDLQLSSIRVELKNLIKGALPDELRPIFQC